MRGLTYDDQGQTEQVETAALVSHDTTLPPSASVAAVHYGHVVGEPWDRETPKEEHYSMSINMVNATYTHYHKERLLIDSGAQCCVCPKDYAPEIEMTKQGKMDLPGLHSGAGENMTALGVKHVLYQ